MGVATTLTAAVADGHDGDTVTFSDGTATHTSTLAGGVATYEWTPVAGDSEQPYSWTATYAGSIGYASSMSGALTGIVAAKEGGGSGSGDSGSMDLGSLFGLLTDSTSS